MSDSNLTFSSSSDSVFMGRRNRRKVKVVEEEEEEVGTRSRELDEQVHVVTL